MLFRSCMEVKKNGKVEHSAKTHDDQVFSYLMALYVWYDGKELAERFHIIKNTIKTDQNEEIEELDIEDSLEATSKVDLESTIYDPESDILKEIESLEKQIKIMTSKELREQTYLKESQQRKILLATNKDAREAYAKETGLDPKSFVNSYAASYVELPDSIFISDDTDMEDQDKRESVLVGNLSDWWDQL